MLIQAFIAAHNHSPATARALLKEMQASLPLDLAFIDKYVPQSIGKAYRFVREMDEMKETPTGYDTFGVNLPDKT